MRNITVNQNLAISGSTRPIEVELYFFSHFSEFTIVALLVVLVEKSIRQNQTCVRRGVVHSDACRRTNCWWAENRSSGASSSSSRPVASDVLRPPHASKADEQHRRHAPARTHSLYLSSLSDSTSGWKKNMDPFKCHSAATVKLNRNGKYVLYFSAHFILRRGVHIRIALVGATRNTGGRICVFTGQFDRWWMTRDTIHAADAREDNDSFCWTSGKTKIAWKKSTTK